MKCGMHRHSIIRRRKEIRYKNLERFDGSCKISTWLCQIARHLLYQYWDRHGKQKHVELDDQIPAECDTAGKAVQR